MTVLILIAAAFVYAAVQNTAVYDSFIKGAEEGIKTAVRIAPYLAAALLLCAMLRTSGAIDLLAGALNPLFSFLQIPVELITMLLVRPVSGAAALSELETLIELYGADSYFVRTACCLMGSSETALYTIALYFGSINVKKSGYVLPVSLFSGVVGAILSSILCKYI